MTKEVNEHFQDSDNANSPPDNSRGDDLNGDKRGKMKRREKYPRCLEPSVTNLFICWHGV